MLELGFFIRDSTYLQPFFSGPNLPRLRSFGTQFTNPENIMYDIMHNLFIYILL